MRHSSTRHFILSALLFLLLIPGGDGYSQFADFITRKGDKLFDGDRELRFISFNIPNLHYIEDYLPFNGTNPWRFPDEFEIRDALNSIKQLGGKVARMYVLSVRREDDEPDIPRHVEGPGKFNEDAFRALDKVLQIANDVGVRVIIPFVDNWRWWGGPREYAAFRGKERDDFWTDPQLIDDIKATIRFLVTRQNSFTGQMYKDDKAILAWETGNELAPPFSWTKEIAAYIKSLDTNHLVMEGIISPDLSEDALDDPNIDIVSTHHYRNPAVSIEKIVDNQSMARGKKPYLIGEYGIIPTQDIRTITDTIIHQGLVGGMLWSLRFRNRAGGFYHHYEYSRIGAYRWPGFSSGEFYDEKGVLALVREKAYEIDGLTQPRLPIPESPELLPIVDVSAIAWQGSTGAQSYIVERLDADSSDWQVVADGIDDAKYQYRPLYSDETAASGRRYSYRVRARNESGLSDYSNIVGPVEERGRKLVDEMENFNKVFQKDGDLQLLTYQDVRRAKEDRSRLRGDDGSYIVYKTPVAASAISVDAFAEDQDNRIHIFASQDLREFSEVSTTGNAFVFGNNDYRFFDAVTFSAPDLPEGTQYLKIELSDGVQISRVEVTY